MTEYTAAKLKAIQEIRTGLSEVGIPCDIFKAINNLYKAYLKKVELDPTFRQAVLDGKFIIVSGVKDHCREDTPA